MRKSDSLMALLAIMSACLAAADGYGAEQSSGGWRVTVGESELSYRSGPQRIPEGASPPEIPEELKILLSAERYYWKCYVNVDSELMVAETGYAGLFGNIVRVYSRDARQVRELVISEGFNDIDISAEGLIAAATPAMGLVIYGPQGNRMWKARDWNVRQVYFDASGDRLACLAIEGGKGRLRLISAREGALLGEEPVGENAGMFVSPDLSLLALREGTPGDFTVSLMEFPSLELRWSAEHALAEPGAPLSLQWGGMLIDPKGGYLAFLHFPGVRWTGEKDYTRSAELIVLDLADGKRVCGAEVTYAEGMRLEWHQGQPVLRIGRYVRRISIRKPQP